MQTGTKQRSPKQSQIKRARCRLKRLGEKRADLLRQLLVVEKQMQAATRDYDNLADYMGWNR